MGPEHFERALKHALQGNRRGTVLLVDGEGAMDDLSVVRALRPMLRRGGVYHLTPELTAVILVSVGPGESWTLLDAAREALSESGVSVRLSAASWPMQGSTVADLVTEAVAALSAEKPAVTQHHDELEFEHLSELLTG